MRIRKNARLITSPSSSSFLVCQLNRSPWDVDSSSLQADWEDGFGVSGSLDEAFPSSDSFPSGKSMELSFEYVEKSLPLPPPLPLIIKTQGGENVGEEIQIGGSNDKRIGWQHIHHQLKPPPPLKVGPPLPPIPTVPKKRGRPKKPTTAATTTTSITPTTPVATNNNSGNNPYEFYYYSGFGPKWSKRRGGSKYIGGGNDNKDADESPGSSSTSHIISEDDKDDDDNKKNNCNTTSTSKVFVMESKVNDELDYIEDDFDDDDEDKDANSSGRRVRKPVKARSLKSLM